MDDDEAPSQPPSQSSDLRELSQLAFDAFCTFIDHCQRDAPLLLVLDDLQWVDEESVTLLNALLTRGSGRIVILGLARSEVNSGNAQFHSLTQLIDQRGGLRLPLDPMTEKESA